MIYSIDCYRFKEPRPFFGGSSLPREHFVQFGAMMGKYFGEEGFRLHLQSGITYIRGIRRTDFISSRGFIFPDSYYNHEDYSTLGLALKIGFKFNSVKSFGCGFDLQANINPKNPVLMTMFSIQLGKLRTVSKIGVKNEENTKKKKKRKA